MNPLLFFGGILLIILLGVLGAYVAMGYGVAAADKRVRGWLVPYLESQADMAAGVGLSPLAWVGLRAVVTAVTVIIGLSTHILVTVILLGIAGYAGFPWAMRQRAEKRQMKLDRAMVETVAEIVDRMKLDRGFDQVLREVASNPRAEVAHVLAPVLKDQAVTQSLVEVAERSRSRVTATVCLNLLLARSRGDQGGLIDLLENTMLPTLRATQEIQEQDLIANAELRGIVWIMLVITLTAFFGVQIVPNFHAVYQTTAGQIVVLFSAAIFLLTVYTLDRARPRTRFTRWDLRGIRQEFAGGGYVA